MKPDLGMPNIDEDFDPGAFWLCSIGFLVFLAAFFALVGWVAGWWS